MHVSDPRRDERGFATLALVTVLMPLMLMVGVFLQTMKGRQDRLHTEVLEEQALMAAEAGIDVAMNEARRGTLVAGPHARFEFAVALSGQSRVDIVCEYLGDDDADNDGDLAVDEEDEGVFRAIATGHHGTAVRRVAAYLRFTDYMPALGAAITLTNPAVTVDISGEAMVDGANHTMAGAPVGANDVLGIAMTPPGTLADLTGEISTTGGNAESGHIGGLGGLPSLGAGPFLDVATLVDVARTSAGHVLTNSNVVHPVGSASEPVFAFREGDLEITSDDTSYGVLVVDGNLRVAGSATWNGIIITTGTVEMGAGEFTLNGGMVLGPSSPLLMLRGSIDLDYSEEALALMRPLLGRYALQGWQEITTNGTE